jgi:ribosomal-protein-alanine N-acetyltransferase
MVVLKTNRLLLRQFTPDDVDDVLEYTQDPEWSRYQVNIPPVPLSRKMAEELVAMFSNPPATQGILQIFAIVLKGKVIGELCLNQHEEDRRNERFELTYSISRQHWGKGLMTEATQEAVNWAFQTFSFNRMYAWCDPKNIGSWRVMEKLGMKREGLLRSHIKWNGEFRDQLYYGMLREEWRKIHANEIV